MLGLEIGELYLKASTDAEISALEAFGNDCGQWSRGLNWWVGDLYIIAERRLGGDNASQVLPEFLSPGYIARCKGVAAAYKPEDRNPLATWSQHMQVAGKPDRQQILAEIVEQGLTTDESRAAQKEDNSTSDRPRWLLAVDVSYHLTRTWSSGAGTEAAMTVDKWVQRTVERLKEKGLTDCVCCLDSPNSFRKLLTKDWEDHYKPRATKDAEHSQQLTIVGELLEKNFCCVKVDGMEADDILASYAKSFDGKVTLLTTDKDMRQCLSSKCNMLTDIGWIEDPTSGQQLPDYKWLSAKKHTEGVTYSGARVEGIPPEKWTEFQTLAGDSVDGVSGVSGIGGKGAADLIKQYGTVEAVIEAAKAGDESIREKKRTAIIEFEPKLGITRQLVTLVDDLIVPGSTRLT